LRIATGDRVLTIAVATAEPPVRFAVLLAVTICRAAEAILAVTGFAEAVAAGSGGQREGWTVATAGFAALSRFADAVVVAGEWYAGSPNLIARKTGAGITSSLAGADVAYLRAVAEDSVTAFGVGLAASTATI
jgi:hypothetical protein